MSDPLPLDRRELRRFGLLMGAVVAVLFGLLLPWLFGRPPLYWPWLLGAGFGLAAWLRPQVLGPAHALWMRFGHVMGLINTHLLLGLVFFALIAPIGLILRLLRVDPLRKPPAGPDTFRGPSRHRPPQHMDKPF